MKLCFVLPLIGLSVCLLLNGCLEELTAEQIKDNAESNLSSHLHKDEDVLIPSCSSQDSDYDGYVTCDTKSKQTAQYQSFECNYRPGMTGCRLARHKLFKSDRSFGRGSRTLL